MFRRFWNCIYSTHFIWRKFINCNSLIDLRILWPLRCLQLHQKGEIKCQKVTHQNKQ